MLMGYLKNWIQQVRQYCKKNSLLAFELGFNEIRLLQLEKTPLGFQLVQMLSHAVPAMHLTQEKSWQSVQTDLTAWILQLGVTGYEAAFALPAVSIIQKRIELSGDLHEQAIAHELWLRSSQYFPGINEKEIYADFAIQSADADKCRVLWVAAHKAQLEKEIQIFTEARLKTKIIDIDIYALARAGAWFLSQDQKDFSAAVILLDFRWPLFSFLVLQQNELLFHHQWRITQAAFMNPLAEEIHLIQQIKTIWQLFQETQSKVTINLFILSGEVPALPAIAAALEQEFALAVKLANPFQYMTIPSALSEKAVNQRASSFLLCSGLALRGPILW